MLFIGYLVHNLGAKVSTGLAKESVKTTVITIVWFIVSGCEVE